MSRCQISKQLPHHIFYTAVHKQLSNIIYLILIKESKLPKLVTVMVTLVFAKEVRQSKVALRSVANVCLGELSCHTASLSET